MSQNKKVTQAIENLKQPELSLPLKEEEIKFIEEYAKEREVYNNTTFNMIESRIIRSILDRIFTSYIIAHEQNEYDLYNEYREIRDIKARLAKRRSELQAVGEHLYEVRSDDQEIGKEGIVVNKN